MNHDKQSELRQWVGVGAAIAISIIGAAMTYGAITAKVADLVETRKADSGAISSLRDSGGRTAEKLDSLERRHDEKIASLESQNTRLLNLLEDRNRTDREIAGRLGAIESQLKDLRK